MSLLSKLDAWGSMLSGMAGSSDKLTTARHRMGDVLNHLEIAEIMATDGIGSRIVKAIPNDMVRNGWAFQGDENGDLRKALKDLKANEAIRRALIWQRAFGGALILMDAADGKPLDQPLDPKAKAPVRSLKVFSSARVQLHPENFSTDPLSPYFEEQERYEIRRLYSTPFQVHASRCLVFKGEPVPDTLEQLGFELSTRYWGMSALQETALYLAGFGTFYGALGHLSQEMTIGKYTISNLDNLVAMNDWKALKARLKIIDNQKSVIHAVLLGKEEKYERDSLTFAGIPEVMDRLMLVLSAASGIPVTKFWGRSAAGMNASGEGDSRDYYDGITARQGAELEPQVLKLGQLVNRGIAKPIKEDGLAVEFNPVWSPTAKEHAEVQKLVMETDIGYINAKVLDQEQIFNNRFKNGYSATYQIEGEFIDQGPDDEEMLAQLAALQAKAAGGTKAPIDPKDPKNQVPQPKAPVK